MALLGGVQRRDLPGQIVIPGPGGELVDAHRHTHPKAISDQPERSADPGVLPVMQKVCRTSDFEIGRGYVKQTWICRGDRSTCRQRLTAEGRTRSMRRR